MKGLALIVLAQVAFAFGGLVIRKYLENYNPIFVTAIMAIISASIFLPIIFFAYKSELGGIANKNFLPFIIAAILWLVVAETLYISGFQKAPSLTTASLMTLFYPLFSAILGIMFLNEVLNIKIVSAAILMVAGFILLII